MTNEGQGSGFTSAQFNSPPELTNKQDKPANASPGVSIAAFNAENYTDVAY
jgi:hypothetical protein